LNTTQTALARVTADRDRAEKRLKELEAARIAQTPGIKERLVELSKHGRAGYVQLLLARTMSARSAAWRAVWQPVAEIDRVRLEAHRRTVTAERDALNELDQKYDEVDALQKDAARARAAVEAAVAARSRMIAELDQRRDLAAQFVAELQQAQSRLDETIASAGAGSSVVALPLRPFKGDLPWPTAGHRDHAIRGADRQPFRHEHRP
jgi:septal ring factor EnvC (AmiA/AmiB activator)